MLRRRQLPLCFANEDMSAQRLRHIRIKKIPVSIGKNNIATTNVADNRSAVTVSLTGYDDSDDIYQ